MNLTIGGYSPQTAPMQTQQAPQLTNSAQDLSKDLVKANVETMLSIGRMEYIGTLVNMFV